MFGTRVVTLLGAVGVILGLGGCAAKVKQEDYNSDMAKLREEMQAGNKDLASKIDATDATVADHSRRLDALEQELQAFRSEYNVSIEKVRGMLKFDVRCSTASRLWSGTTTRAPSSRSKDSPIPPGVRRTTSDSASVAHSRSRSIWAHRVASAAIA